jgi:hypothetical protein
MRKSILLVAAILACGVVSSASAQYRSRSSTKSSLPRFEISPVAGYMWGGGADFSSQGGQPGGSFSISDGLLWGADVAFRGAGNSWIELFYRRQDTKLDFRENVTGNTRSGDFATNYIHIGGRQDFAVHKRIMPYIRGSLGMTIFDPKFQDLGTDTRFSLSLGGGFTYMLPSQRVGIRGNLQGWFTFVPTNDVGIYCSPFFPYYCYAATTSQTVSQGEVSGALVFRF